MNTFLTSSKYQLYQRLLFYENVIAALSTLFVLEYVSVDGMTPILTLLDNKLALYVLCKNIA